MYESNIAKYASRMTPSQRNLRQVRNEDTQLGEYGTFNSNTYGCSASASSVSILHKQMNQIAFAERERTRIIPRGPRSILTSKSLSGSGRKQVRFDDHDQLRQSRRTVSCQEHPPYTCTDEDDIYFGRSQTANLLRVGQFPTARLVDADDYDASESLAPNISPRSIPNPRAKRLSPIQLNSVDTANSPIEFPVFSYSLARKPVGSSATEPADEHLIDTKQSRDCSDESAHKLSHRASNGHTSSSTDMDGTDSSTVDPDVTCSMSAINPDPLRLLTSVIQHLSSLLPPLPSLSSPDEVREFHASATWFAKLFIILYIAASIWAILAAIRDVILNSLQPLAWIITGLAWILKIH
jgi:hypothetical protein